jgi:oleate hydratase
MKEFARIETLGGVKRTVYNQYDSLVLPLQVWLSEQGVQFLPDSTVVDIDSRSDNGLFVATGLQVRRHGRVDTIPVEEGSLVFFQNASMTDASSRGSMKAAPGKLNKHDSGGWDLWEKLAEKRSDFGNPSAFNSCIAQSWWESFTVTLKDKRFFEQMIRFSDNQPGTGGLVTFKDSNWLMSIVLAHQPHFANQPASVQVFWGYALFPDRIGNYVAKPMTECSGAEILQELLGHLRFDAEVFEHANCIPCRMPYITSMFMPRKPGDRPLPVPESSKNLAFVSQFVEIPQDVVFTVEYSVRAAQMAVYQLLGIDKEVPPVSAHDKSLDVQFKALLKAFQFAPSHHPEMNDSLPDPASSHVWHDSLGRPGRM